MWEEQYPGGETSSIGEFVGKSWERHCQTFDGRRAACKQGLQGLEQEKDQRYSRDTEGLEGLGGLEEEKA